MYQYPIKIHDNIPLKYMIISLLKMHDNATKGVLIAVKKFLLRENMKTSKITRCNYDYILIAILLFIIL